MKMRCSASPTAAPLPSQRLLRLCLTMATECVSTQDCYACCLLACRPVPHSGHRVCEHYACGFLGCRPVHPGAHSIASRHEPQTEGPVAGVWNLCPKNTICKCQVHRKQ